MAKIAWPGLAVFLALFLTQAVAMGPPGTILPSRRAEIVLPLLKKFTSHENLTWIDQVLGKPDIDMGSAVYVNYYTLSDHTAILVGVDMANGQVLYIRRAHGKQADELIYSVNAHWAKASR